MPSLEAMLNPRCPNHPRMLAEDHGLCAFCELTTHRHLIKPKPPTKVWGTWPYQRVTYRTEADAYGEGIEDDD